MRFFKSDLADLDESIHLLIEQYVEDNLLKMASPAFHSDLVCAVKDLLWEDCQYINLQECRRVNDNNTTGVIMTVDEHDEHDDDNSSVSSMSSDGCTVSSMTYQSSIHSLHMDMRSTDSDSDNVSTDDVSVNTWISFVSDDTHDAYESWLNRRVHRVACAFFESRTFVPPRSNAMVVDTDTCTDTDTVDLRVNTISPILAKLRAAPQPEQRTDEWYKHRHELITASSAWKVIASPAQQASFIREKCKPLQNHFSDMAYTTTSRPIEDLGRLSSLQWGVVFEHVTAEIYAWKNNGVTIEEFGCIRHFDDDCRFLGASPDGIVVAPVSSPKYGKLIEIKNIVNREIDGIPKEEYWVQMQLQMEVCDLDECDFVETRFKEFDDGEIGFFSDDHRHRGVILSFANVNMTTMETRIQRVYMPVDTAIVDYRDKSAVEEWINQTRSTMRAQKWMLNYTLYWYLDQYSCIPVERNRPWACAVMPVLRDMWARVEAARIASADADTTISTTLTTTTTRNTAAAAAQRAAKPNAPHICFVKKLL